MTILLIICSVAVGHALFWATVLMGLNKRLSNRLLSALLILLSLRVGKSVVGMILPGNMFLFATIGVVSMAGIGPALYFFTRSLFDSSFKLRRSDYLHFLPIPGLLIMAINPDWSFLNMTYRVFTTHVLVYILLSFHYLLKRKEILSSDDLKWKWMTYVLMGVSIIWVTFVCQLLFYHPLVYQIIVITAAVVFYTLSWWAIQRSKLFLEEPRRKATEAHLYDELGKRILSLLEQEETYIDPNLTVTKLAAQIKAPAYLVSRAINHCFEKSFSEMVLQYRIRKSEQLLLADTNKSLTIEAIAFESGFNTLSAFYTAFKKINKTTPAQFRERPGDARMRIA